ncbi:hemerythrin domain-containing protein [Actinomycetospora sp. C-140]
MTLAPPSPTPAPGGPAPEEPATAGDLVPFGVVDRVTLRDVGRLARFADGLAAGTVAVTERRALAVAERIERVCEEIHHRHGAEETLLWPLLERHAGRALDLSGLRDDHVALRGLLGEVRRLARGVLAALLQRPTALATAEDFGRMRTLARRLAELTDLLDEHLRDSARELTDAVAAVPRDAWRRATRALFATAPDRVFTAVRAHEAATPDEARPLAAALGRGVAGPFARRAVRRHDRLVFGE